MPILLRGSRDLTLSAIAELTRSRLVPGGPTDRLISGIAALDTAGPSDVAFVDDEKFLDELADTHAGACLMPERLAAYAPRGVAVLVNEEPHRAFVAVAHALFPGDTRPSSLFETNGRAASAHVHATSRIEANVTIDPLAVIGPRAEVGTGTLVAAGRRWAPTCASGASA
jgi:UDP-3-O-[3-hydroxymyristoyl] glucosamine N-acyltransferase